MFNCIELRKINCDSFEITFNRFISKHVYCVVFDSKTMYFMGFVFNVPYTISMKLLHFSVDEMFYKFNFEWKTIQLNIIFAM